MKNLPKLLQFLLIFIPSLTLLLVALRFAFYIVFNDANNPISMDDFTHAMWLGFRFDLRMVVVMSAPLFFLGWIKYLNPFEYKPLRYFWLTYLSVVFAIFALFYIVDFGYFAYLKTRLDFASLRLLENFDIAMQMVWESYPIVWILLGYLLAIFIFVKLTNKLMLHVSKTYPPKRKLSKNILIGFISFLIMFVMGYSKLSQYPLRWSDAAFSKHPFANQLAYNPIHYFLDTYKNGRIAYDKKKVQKYYPLIANYLGVKNKDIKNLNFKRAITPKHTIGEKPNVVIVVMESFATYKSSLSNNPLNPSPYMKALADKGYYFKNYFSPATGTARSIYCTVTSLPDVELKGTSSRNPLIVNQHSIIEDFKGYEKFYFIGGSASWGNIRGMLNQSMDNLHLYEEEDYDSPRNDVWGISDADLAVEANKVLSKTKEPFFAIIQTAGNHRPYTIPDNAYDFKLRNDVDDKEVQKYGFDSLKEFNSFRFLDYSVGLFIERAKKEPYFKNTIFVFYGDHGISGFAGKHTRKYEGSNGMSLGELRVPFIIYSPLIKDPQTFDKVISETDVMPTIASLCGISYNATTIGRDVFDKQFDDKRYAFTIHHKSNPTIGVVDSKFYYKVYYDGSNPRLYDIYKDDGKNYVKEYPQIAKKMDDLTRGIFESARYIPYFNKREDAK